MEKAKFVLSKEKLRNQLKILKNIGFKITYSYKTNHEVGKVLQDLNQEVSYSIHSFDEIEDIKDKSKIQFFCQAESEEDFKNILDKGILFFVVDNEIDLNNLMNVVEKEKKEISLGLRMKFQEHRVGSGKYFVYGMPSKKVNELISHLDKNNFIKKLGVHIHRKSQNTSEWEIVEELKDSIDGENLNKIKFINFGGGLPSIYRSSNDRIFKYIFEKLRETVDWLKEKNIESYIEPGRFLAAPCIQLISKIIQKQKKVLIINTSIYNCELDTLLTGTKLLVKGEFEDGKGDFYLIKGNSPTRDDIFRYKVQLKDPNVGDEIVFLNAGAYNYSTDFFGYRKIETEIVEDFP